MTKFWLLLVLTVSIAQALDDQIVPCPTDDQKFAQCFICKSSHESKGKIYCSCLNQQFKMLGSCLQPQYPCDLILTNLMYDQKDKDKGFNIWDHKVSALLQWKFQEAMKTQTFPDPSPQYVNEMDFLGMPEAFRQGWGQVYFLYVSLQNQIKQLDSNAQDALVVDGIKFFQQIKNYKYEQQWAQLNKFVNQKLHLHWNLSEFQQTIGQRISHIIPCHQCSLLYGFLFIKSEMKCYKCPPACTTCTNNTSDCVSCLQGYFLNQSSKQCQPCSIAHCSNCTSEGTCSKCEGNLILYQNFCYHPDSYCSSNCQNCQPGNPSHCTACSIVDYSLQPNQDTKKCFKCDHDDCMMCRPENTTFCLECLRGFYAGQNGVCVRCMDDCLVCEGEQNCSVCRYGFSIHNNKCTACLVPGCKYCKDDPKLCSECLTEKLVLNPVNKTCHLYQGATLNYHILEPVLNCSRGCLFCYNNNTQQCHTCQVRYFLDVKARVCRRCISGCIQCLDENSCIDCESGYYLHEHQCLNCTGPHCQCGNDGKCYRCYDGYEFKQGVCTLVAQPYGCMHFDAQNSSVCKICEPGFAKTLQDKCIQCESHCKLSCNPHNVSQCRQSRYQMVRPYYIFSLKEDQTCIYINGNCIVPKDGYEIREINGTFVSHRVCFHPCHECDLDFVCTKCKPGYLLSDGACTPDISCNPKCQHCLSGSHRDSQTHNCVLCSEPHCNACINTTTCVQCNEGFYLQKLQASAHCKKCIQSCKICMNQIDCQTCAVGYFQLANMKCQKCNENCLTCQHLRTKCLSCRPGSRLLGNRCIGVHSVQFYYRIKGDPKEFKHNVKSEAFILEISKLLNISKEEIYLLNTTQTPLSISGLVSAPTQASSSKMFTHLQQPGIQNFQVLCQSLSHLHETQKIGYYSNLQSTCQKKQDDDDNDDDDEKGGLGAGAIVAIVLCCIIASIVVVIGVIKAIRKLKSRNSWSTQHSQSHELSQGSDNYYQQYMDAN